MEITVFTPAYNRAYILENLYRSLQRQTFKDFEWVIVDDGSTDNTEELIAGYLKESNDFSIVYEKVKNGGKHRAVNTGVLLASGNLFFIVDSDDYITDDALQIIHDEALLIEKDKIKEYAGLIGLKGYPDGKISGTTFEGKILDATYIEAPGLGITGEKADVYFTDVLKKFPFPEFENEKFMPESVLWNEIAAAGLKLRYFNKVIYIFEYLPDGLTSSGKTKELNNPGAYGLLIQQRIKYGRLHKMKKWEAIYSYYIALNGKYSMRQIAKNLGMKPIEFTLRMYGMRLFYKIYS